MKTAKEKTKEENVSEWEIREIRAKARFKYYFCSEGACIEPATHYLVLKPNGPMRFREARMRRCEKHARQNAASLHIPFPEKASTE